MKSSRQTIADLYNLEGPIEYREEPFQVVWRKQTKLMEAYKAAGRLSQWPIDINNPKSEAFYRELFGFLEEEIIEASEQVDLLLDTLENNKEGAKNVLIDLNEEVADALHFWIETFIFLSFMPRSFEKYYEDLSAQYYLNSGRGDIFKLAFQFSENYLRKEGKLAELSGASTYTVEMEPLPYEQAGSRISLESKELYESLTLKTIKHLQLAKNCLKNKYWKSKEYEVNVALFNQHLMEAWIYWTMSLVALGLRPAALIQNYLLKNKINHNKISTH